MIAQHFAAPVQTHGYDHWHPITLALLQDAPFAVVNSLFLLRSVDDVKRPHDDTNVTVLLKRSFVDVQTHEAPLVS